MAIGPFMPMSVDGVWKISFTSGSILVSSGLGRNYGYSRSTTTPFGTLLENTLPAPISTEFASMYYTLMIGSIFLKRLIFSGNLLTELNKYSFTIYGPNATLDVPNPTWTVGDNNTTYYTLPDNYASLIVVDQITTVIFRSK